MWNVIGHDDTVASLDAALRAGRLSRALLLTGPAGTGKTHLALELARALNCTGVAAPCGTCLHCRQIAHGAHPDVVLIERPEGKTMIQVDQVRDDLIDPASLRPFQGRMKVFIIVGAEDLSGNAADALLKTLEEPGPQVTIILTAGDPGALPATILSRCQVVLLHPVSPARLEAALRERGQDEVSAARLARAAQGSVGWALRAVQNPKLLADQEATVTRLAQILEMDVPARLDLAESLTAERKDRTVLRRNLELLLLVGRDLLLLAGGQPAQFVGGELQSALSAQAARLSLADLHAFLTGLGLAMQRIDRNVDARLALEALFMRLP